MNMTDFSNYAHLAMIDPTMAAEGFLSEMTEKDQKTVELILDASTWKEKDIETFAPVLIEGRWGRFWLVRNPEKDKDLIPKAPMVTLRGIKALGKGLVKALVK